ncbi:uncharacterized protein LOC128674481 [Plodia interpunctella]|uniref:uncharacterized protein LOC128674481 n=1 Tax=Plodia interpunctella TaxID=58824 RepID=UPI0023682DCD|nr:uncharacterized protein LOC128674481 [Plodia interpunctella]
MQTVYPKKHDAPQWDPVKLEYPIRKFPNTNISSETMARTWKLPPEIIKTPREPIEELREYLRDYNVTKELTQSQTTQHFGYKPPDTRRHNKHTSCNDNRYIYPPPRKLEDRPPQCSAHGSTEMRSAYIEPITPPRLVTDKDQFKHPANLPGQEHVPPSFHKELEPLDTTHDGFQKYLDPYLTTSRLHHRPFTADQLSRQSASRDIVTYYTLANTPWAWSAKPKIENWNLPPRRPKSMYDREKFKQDFREIRTHNQLQWVPGSFRTETRDNYVPQDNFDVQAEVGRYYKRTAAKLSTKDPCEESIIRQSYRSENSRIGSGVPLCADIDPFVEKNKVVERLSVKNVKKWRTESS